MKNGTKKSPGTDGAHWDALFQTMRAEKDTRVKPGVEREIESDLSGKGGTAIARRAGIAYLTQPFRKTAEAMAGDNTTAEAFLELAKAVGAAAGAHREVARMLDMAESRMMVALRHVAVERPKGARHAA